MGEIYIIVGLPQYYTCNRYMNILMYICKTIESTKMSKRVIDASGWGPSWSQPSQSQNIQKPAHKSRTLHPKVTTTSKPPFTQPQLISSNPQSDRSEQLEVEDDAIEEHFENTLESQPHLHGLVLEGCKNIGDIYSKNSDKIKFVLE